MKQNILEFDPVIYPRKVWISINPDIGKLKERFDDIEELDETTCASVFCTYDKIKKLGGVLIVFKNKKDLNADLITHESIHAALRILEYVGYMPDYNNQEPLTYLAGWIASCCEKVKNNKHELSDTIQFKK